MKSTINEFRGYYAFLSNMYPSQIKLGSVTYTCAEAAFQAVKLQDKSKRKMFAGLSGPEAKRLGRKIALRQDWEKIKVDVMRWIVHEKFQQNKKLLFKLIRSTEDDDIVEGNTWGDTFWGVCNGNGLNWLGRILMEERKNIPDHSDYVVINDIPSAILAFIDQIRDEEGDAGYGVKDIRVSAGEFYKVEFISYAMRGHEEEHVAYLVYPDGDELILLERKPL